MEITIKTNSLEELKQVLSDLLAMQKEEAQPKQMRLEDLPTIEPKTATEESIKTEDAPKTNITMEEAKERIARYTRTKGNASLKAALTELGYKKVSEVPTDKLESLLEKVGA